MAYTVTATNNFGGNGITLQVEVITGAVETGGASGQISNGNGSGNFTISLTPNYSSSLIVWAANDAEAAVAAITPATNNKLLTVAANTDSFEDTANGYTAGAGYYSGTVTSGTPVTAGSSNAAGQQSPQLAVYEIHPSPTWAEDASTPAFLEITATTTGTSASFTPPASAVLAAIVSCNFSGAGSIGSEISVSSTPALTWTLRAYNTGATNNGGVAIYTATVPGGPAAQFWGSRYPVRSRVPEPYIQGKPGLLRSSMAPGNVATGIPGDVSAGSGRVFWSAGGPVHNPPAPLPFGPLPNRPVIIAVNSGWRNAGHSR